jgi:hypothetical protein
VFVGDGEISGSTTEAASGTLTTFGILILTCWSIQVSRRPVEGGPSLHSFVPDKFPSAIHAPSTNSDQSPTVKGTSDRDLIVARESKHDRKNIFLSADDRSTPLQSSRIGAECHVGRETSSDMAATVTATVSDVDGVMVTSRLTAANMNAASTCYEDRRSR